MSEYPKFVSRYVIDGLDDEVKKDCQDKYKKEKKKKKTHRTKLYKEENDKGNTFRGALLSFGSVLVIKAKCPVCGDIAIVSTQFKFLCCGALYEHEPVAAENASTYIEPRRKPTPAKQKEILRKQKGRCFYCDQAFDVEVKYYGSWKRMSLAWDHLLPYSYTGSCRNHNFVAACSICNSWKSDKIFKTIEDAREYLQDKWKQATS